MISFIYYNTPRRAFQRLFLFLSFGGKNIKCESAGAKK